MTYDIYVHELGEVRLPPGEASQLENLQRFHALFGKDYADTRGWLREALDAYQVKMADIEKVARWKFERARLENNQG